MEVKGFTIKEMATILGIAPNAVKQRLSVAGLKPITREAIYSRETLEAIRNVPGKGRPRKQAEPENQPAGKAKPAKPAKPEAKPEDPGCALPEDV
jgi:hypothetical protein